LKKDVLGEWSEGCYSLRVGKFLKSKDWYCVDLMRISNQPSCKYEGIFMDGLWNESRSPYATIGGRKFNQQAESYLTSEVCSTSIFCEKKKFQTMTDTPVISEGKCVISVEHYNNLPYEFLSAGTIHLQAVYSKRRLSCPPSFMVYRRACLM
jgi:hypothetical protein